MAACPVRVTQRTLIYCSSQYSSNAQYLEIIRPPGLADVQLNRDAGTSGCTQPQLGMDSQLSPDQLHSLPHANQPQPATTASIFRMEPHSSITDGRA